MQRRSPSASRPPKACGLHFTQHTAFPWHHGVSLAPVWDPDLSDAAWHNVRAFRVLPGHYGEYVLSGSVPYECCYFLMLPPCTDRIFPPRPVLRSLHCRHANNMQTTRLLSKEKGKSQFLSARVYMKAAGVKLCSRQNRSAQRVIGNIPCCKRQVFHFKTLNNKVSEKKVLILIRENTC